MKRIALFFLLWISPVTLFQINPNQWNKVKLNIFRKHIDFIDENIYFLLETRQTFSNKTILYKETQLDPLREMQILNRLENKNKLDKTFVRNIWSNIFSESRRQQK